MQFRTHLLASAALIATFGTAVLADAHSEMSSDTVVATVNGTDITLGHLIAIRAQLPQQYQQLPDDVVFNGLVEQLVNQQLLADSLEDEPKRVGITLENETRSLRAGEVINEIGEVPPTDEEIQAAYDARFADVTPVTELNASHILVETEEEAIEIKQLVDDGADFAELAQERSTGPSGPSGGSLGWFGPGMMVPEFEAAAIALEDGEVSDPVQTQFGWHVVKLNETRTGELPSLESLRTEIATDLQQRKLNDLVESLSADAEITLPEDGAFDFSVIQDLSLLED